MRHLAQLAICIALLAIPVAARADAAAASTVSIVYLSLKPAGAPPSAILDPKPMDEAIQGARLAVADNATTGQFLNQVFKLTEIRAPSDAALLEQAAKSMQAGERLFVADLPASLLLGLADLPAAKGSIFLDATSRDDALRGADCRASMLHMLPSRAMLTDALMQYLVAKDWRRIMLLSGTMPADKLYADAVRRSAEKFQVSIRADRSWSFNAAAQQADTGHYQVNDEVAKATQEANYDLLVVADEEGNFGDELAYRTALPRPVGGTAGLTPSAWAAPMDEYASTQLQLRFLRAAGRRMTERDYGGWLAVRAIGEAATRTGSTDPPEIIAYLRGADFSVSGYKGPPFTFRPWDGQLRQPVLLADARSLVSVAPLPGFLHENNDLDSLGTDQPETQCHMH